MAIIGPGNPLTFTAIGNEFNNNTQPLRLSNYYKGGGRVPAEVTASIPTSGEIKFSQFYGAQNQIDPPIPIGGYMHGPISTTRTYPGNGNSIFQWNNDYTNTQLWKGTTWRWTSTVTCEASYVSLSFYTYVEVNGVILYDGFTPCCQNSYFRYNSGTLNYTGTFSLTGGSNVKIVGYASGRNTGGETPSATMTVNVQRLS